MRNACCLLVVGTLLLLPAGVYAESGESTRVVDSRQHACTISGGYPYREKSEYVLEELDLQTGDVVADVGAGDGWWTERMAERVGPEGVIHASEVDQKKVDRMKEQLADLPQVKPYVCPTDGTGLPEDSCDLAFLSKTYHHLPDGIHVDYWRHLHEVVKPTGRVCVIERHAGLSQGRSKQHAWSPGLLMEQAEEGGWVPVRYEMIGGTHHFLAVFVQRELCFPAKR